MYAGQLIQSMKNSNRQRILCSSLPKRNAITSFFDPDEIRKFSKPIFRHLNSESHSNISTLKNGGSRFQLCRNTFFSLSRGVELMEVPSNGI